MKNFLKNSAVQSLIASLLCIVLGLLIGYVVLLFINPSGAGDAIMAVIRNFFNYSRANLQLKNFGNTLVKTAPLLMCALSVLFAYKVGLFNIGADGQYVAGACASLYAALAWGWGWLPCMLFAVIAGAVLGGDGCQNGLTATAKGVVLAYGYSRNGVDGDGYAGGVATTVGICT